MGLYSLIAYTNTRVIVLDQLQPNSINRTKTLNPQPAFFSIAANTYKMNQLFQLVSTENFLHKFKK